MKKHLRSSLVLLLVLFSFITTQAHVWEIRVNQNTDGSLVWYVQSYHGLSECGFENSGIVINGTQYPLEQTFAGSCAGISPTIFAQNPSYVSNPGYRASYAIIHTPFLGTTLNVQPYSTNVCWSSLVSGSGNFTPPPPPVCTSFPVTGWSNTVSLPGNNQGTACDPTDDTLPVTVTVNHQSCGSITGDGKFSLVLDPGGANITYGPFSYSTAITTNVSITVPYGFNASTQLSVIDNDFAGSQATHGLTGIAGSQYNGVPDSSPPVVLTQSFTVPLNDSGSAVITVANIDAGSSDNCGIASLILSQTTFSCSDIGANTVTLTATDINGNVNSATAVVTVVDNSGPMTGGTTTLAIAYGGQTNGWSPWYSYFSDPLPAGSTLTGIDLTYTAKDQGWGGTGAPSDMSVSGTYIGSGVLWHSSITNTIHFTGSFPSYIYGGTNNLQMNFWGYPGWQAFWQGGTLTFHYQQAGGADCLSITRQLDASGQVTITSDEVNPGFTDACGIASLALSKYSFDCSNVGDNQVILTATDNNGNVSTCTALVTIQDQIAPVAIAQNITIQLDASGTASITAAQVNNGSSDACGIASLMLSQTAFDCSNVGINTVTLTVTDVNGNVSTATASVTVQDNIAPVALTQDITIQLDASGTASITSTQINHNSTDACGIASLMLSQTAFDCSNVGVNTVILTVTDVNGNVSTATASVTVQDNIAPGLTVPANIVQLNDAGVCGAIVNIGLAVATDNCTVASVTSDALAFYPVGVTIVTWTAVDVNGNTTTGTQTVEITNNAPVIGDLTVSPLIQLGSATLTSATHADNNLISGTWNWGDGSSTAAVIAGTQLSGSHIYSHTGLYDVSLTIVDACGKTDTEDYSYLVIYNPCNGFITGGGFISTPAGALASNAAVTGKSNYGFNAKYLKGDLVPTGEFNFHINSSGFKVKSTSLNWLMVNNDQAILKGMATVDGQVGYHFIASVLDGNIVAKNGTDYLRLIVWDNAGNVVYDNQYGDQDNARAFRSIENGQIVIHKSKTGDCYNYEAAQVSDNGSNASSQGGNQQNSLIIDLTPVQIELIVYPNPVVDNTITISIENFGNTQANVDLTNLAGQQLYSIPSVNFIGGMARIDFKQARLKSGNYLVRVSEIGGSRVGTKQIIVSQKK